MTTHFLILSPHEVRAALRGELGLIVRPVKPTVKGCTVGVYHTWANGIPIIEPVNVQEDGDPWTDIKCPLGVPGDRLVLQETWASRGKHTDGHTDMEIEANPAHFSVWYQADCIKNGNDQFNLDFIGRWRSPATMPAWASRITLEVTGVRCVRVQDIDYQWCDDNGVNNHAGTCEIWDSIYSKRYPWKSNPWAWAVNVKRVEI